MLTTEQEAHITKNIKEYIDLQEKFRNSSYSWFRSVITISTALLGVLIALKSGDSENICQHYSFLSTIILLSLCILFGVIHLASEKHLLNQMVNNKGKRIGQMMKGKFDETNLKFVQVSWYYETARKLFYWAFC